MTNYILYTVQCTASIKIDRIISLIFILHITDLATYYAIGVYIGVFPSYFWAIVFFTFLINILYPKQKYIISCK